MTYIQTVLFYLSALIFLAGLLLLALSTKDQDAGGDVIDAEYRPAEEPAFPPCARRSHGWQDSPSRKLASQLFAESVSPKLLQAMQRHTKELEKVQRWRYYAEYAKKGRTRKKYRNKLHEYYIGNYSYCPPHGSRFFRVDANGDLGYPGDSMTAQFMGGRKRWHM